MLERMRIMAKSPLAMVMIGLLILSFAVWGISDVFRGGQGDAVVIVGPNKVSVQEYAQAWDRELNRIIRQSEGKITTKQARDYGLAEQLLQRMTNDAAVDAKASQMGIGMSDRLIAEEIRKLEAFVDPITGKFSDEQYRSTLANARYTPEQFERGVRNDLLRAQIINPVVSGIAAPKSMAQIELNYRGEQRHVTSVVLPEDIIATPEDPTDEVLAGFLAEHPENFRTPELRGASLVTISATDLASEIDVPEDKIKELFEFRQSELSEPETRSWVQLSAPDEATAKIITERLQAGETAEAISQSLNLSPPIVFEDTAQADTPDDQIAQTVFDAKAAGDIGTSEGRLAWAAWKLNGITAANLKTLDDVRDTLRDEFIKEESADKLYELVGNFEDARASGATLEEAAETTGLLLLTLPPVDQTGRDGSGEPIAAIFGQKEILETLFETEEAVESEILETPDGDYYVIRTDSIKAPQTPELADIHDKALEAWKIDTRSREIKTMADKIAEALKTGEQPNAVAERFPGTRVESAILQRGQNIPPLTQRHAALLFQTPVGEVAMAPGQLNQSLYISRVENIIPAGRVPDSQVEETRSTIANALAGDMQAEFLRGLLEQYNVRQDPRLKALALGDNPEG